MSIYVCVYSCWAYLTVLQLLVVFCHCIIKHIHSHIYLWSSSPSSFREVWGSTGGCIVTANILQKSNNSVCFMSKRKWMRLSDDHVAETIACDRYLCQLWTSGECALCFALWTAKVCFYCPGHGQSGYVLLMSCQYVSETCLEWNEI